MICRFQSTARVGSWSEKATTVATPARNLTVIGETSASAGRVEVPDDLSLPGHPEVLALGDMIPSGQLDGSYAVLPGLVPVAMQEGCSAARLVRDRLRGRPCRPFRYRDKANLATIGRARAVAGIKGIHLIGLANRLLVVTRWAVSFLARGRRARLITGEPQPSGALDAVSRIPARSEQHDPRRHAAV